MFRVMLYSQWKWSRLIVLMGSVAGFALPLVSVHGAAREDSSPLQAPELLHAVQSWGVLYPVLAATLGMLVAIASWTPDHRGRHVYALVLPVPRWRYVLLRFGAGALLLAAPITAVLLGALLATMSAAIPASRQKPPGGGVLPRDGRGAPARRVGAGARLSRTRHGPPRPAPLRELRVLPPDAWRRGAGKAVDRPPVRLRRPPDGRVLQRQRPR